MLQMHLLKARVLATQEVNCHEDFCFQINFFFTTRPCFTNVTMPNSFHKMFNSCQRHSEVTYKLPVYLKRYNPFRDHRYFNPVILQHTKAVVYAKNFMHEVTGPEQFYMWKKCSYREAKHNAILWVNSSSSSKSERSVICAIVKFNWVRMPAICIKGMWHLSIAKKITM